MAAVCSADGLMTQGEDPVVQHWSSREDFEHFTQLINAHRLVVMGRKTYQAVMPQPQPERLRVVLTSRPETFAAAGIPGQLEFSAESPLDLVASMTTREYDALLLVGGGTVNAAFLQAGLIDELYLTIEPVLFGLGTRLVDGLASDAPLQLLGIQQLNERGTLLLHYAVERVMLDSGAQAS